MKKLSAIFISLVIASSAFGGIKRVYPNWSDQDKIEFRQMFLRSAPVSVEGMVRESNFIQCMEDYYSSLYSFKKLKRWQGELMRSEEIVEFRRQQFLCVDQIDREGFNNA